MLTNQGIIRPVVLGLAVALAGCNSGGEKAQERTNLNINGDPALEQLTPYQPGSAFGSSAQSCVVLYKEDQSCGVSDIAPIGFQNSADVTPEDIAQRLVVSHQWMGDNFVAVLRLLPQDLLNMFRSINAVVLSFEVKPSFYHSATASIYIDPRYLWLNEAQWSDIYLQEDYRNEYQSQLQFEAAQRYLDPSLEYVLPSKKYNAAYNSARTLEQVTAGLYRLLAHELAHANDFLPQTELASLDTSLTIWDNIRQFTYANKKLHQAHKLSSAELHNAAQVSFRGADATAAVKAMTPQDAGTLFEPDGAADYYAYSSGAEDVAMLFEAFMMRRQYNATADVAFVSNPQVASPSCNDYIIGWGQRDRLAVTEVKARAKLVAEELLQKDLTDEFNQISSRLQTLPYGIGWCDARSMAVASDSASQQFTVPLQVQPYQDDFTRD